LFGREIIFGHRANAGNKELAFRATLGILDRRPCPAKPGMAVFLLTNQNFRLSSHFKVF
jgi:hypothetical protein